YACLAHYRRPPGSGSNEGMHETFEHTADLGLRARAADLDTLFAEAAHALCAALLEDPAAVRAEEPLGLHIAGDDRAGLLFDWLRALLYEFDAHHRVFARFEVHVTDTGLDATAWGEPLDPERHPISHEVKAITYHGLCVEPEGDGWLAEVIVDI